MDDEDFNILIDELPLATSLQRLFLSGYLCLPEAMEAMGTLKRVLPEMNAIE